METTARGRELRLSEVRERMRARGITQKALCEATGIPQANMSGIFSGREYLGHDRRQRLAEAIERLHLDQEETGDMLRITR